MSTNDAQSGSGAVLGNIYGICSHIEEYNRLSGHGRRFKLQSAARYILRNHTRLNVCNRVMVTGEDRVTIKYSPGTERAKYGNLLRCGNAWVCPVCAGQIADTRKKELHVAVVAAMQMDLKPVMITFTLRHGEKDLLLPLLADLLKAYRAMTNHRAYKNIKKKYGFAGYIRGLELTYKTGWHPHLHVMMFMDARLLADENIIFQLEQDLYEVWLAELEKTGRDGIRGIAVNVKAGDFYVAEYIAKYGRLPEKPTWTIESEMTGGMAKRSRDENGRTPFAIVLDYLLSGRDKDAKLFREYAAATKGRSILQWSRGLAEMLGVDLVDDVAALDMTAPDFFEVVTMSVEMWVAIVKTGKRAAVLDHVERTEGNAEAIMQYCMAIYERVNSEKIDPIEEYTG